MRGRITAWWLDGAEVWPKMPAKPCGGRAFDSPVSISGSTRGNKAVGIQIRHQTPIIMTLPRRQLKRYLKSIRNPILQRWLDAYLESRYRATERVKYREWLQSGRPVPPPPAYKQHVVREAGRSFGIHTLVETGTYEGRMISAVKASFRHIYSVELDIGLYSAARARFAGTPFVTILQGDSGKVLRDLVPLLLEPCVFWLDAHFSGGNTIRGDKDSPIIDELRAIEGHASRFGDVVLIDDAREFGSGDYPSPAWVRSWAQTHGFEKFAIENDIIEIQTHVLPPSVQVRHD